MTIMGFNHIWVFKMPESQIKQTNEETLDQTKTNNSIKSPTVYAICSRTKMRNEPLTDGPKPMHTHTNGLQMGSAALCAS